MICDQWLMMCCPLAPLVWCRPRVGSLDVYDDKSVTNIGDLIMVLTKSANSLRGNPYAGRAKRILFKNQKGPLVDTNVILDRPGIRTSLLH